ncbi:hypothetical protein QM467_18630 [Rhodoblastus sp. 17X3]|uniref:hypothetical protein n=1 Tax=Rhodoblastus sp. 17X3 TaxID=3047026 RepID=UPI0024B8271E|nr:hypothetical protein [Rhodoblastus sp. 17X3]MDI9850055.1 hypothetical protein [Rhodoblastus sp. 17X3]
MGRPVLDETGRRSLRLTRRYVSFALWRAAALIAVVMTLGSAPAFAHAADNCRDQVASRNAGLVSIGASYLKFAPVSAESLKGPQDRIYAPIAHSTNAGSGMRTAVALGSASQDRTNVACSKCSAGCCAPACLIVQAAVLPEVRFASTVALPQFAAVAGLNPASLLEPPNSFA